MDRPHPFRFSYRKYEDEPCPLGKFPSNRKRTGSIGWPGTDLSGYFEAGRRICCTSGKCGCVYDDTTSASTVQIQVLESQIPDPKFRVGVFGARHQVLQGYEADGDVEIHYEDAVQFKDANEEDDMGRSTILEVPWPDDHSGVLESVED